MNKPSPVILYESASQIVVAQFSLFPGVAYRIPHDYVGAKLEPERAPGPDLL